ncbi:MAG: RNase adapter RapZ [Endomicrobium sp.]|jgi:UPF0042 nucleotide-binding protein|nr:RNase adapter RapZ [Endomicrobium sp.]
MIKKFYIVSGMSGAGKSQALKIFEDFGFVCVDNLPIQMVDGFIDMCLSRRDDKYAKAVISIDSRAGESIDSLDSVLNYLKSKKIAYKIIFFNAQDDILIRRYSETRRRHPLGVSVVAGIKLERKLLRKVFAIADEAIDTSHMTVGELKDSVSRLTGEKSSKSRLNVSVVSFGYKYGVPNDADIIFDVRFIANPNYVHSLKYKTGMDKAVKFYIEKQKEFKTFFSLFSKLIAYALPGYIKEGKSHLTVALGCTGGRHRSVFTAEKLAAFLKNKRYTVQVNHRDVLRAADNGN